MGIGGLYGLGWMTARCVMLRMSPPSECGMRNRERGHYCVATGTKLNTIIESIRDLDEEHESDQ
jgi:hypothetical protein